MRGSFVPEAAGMNSVLITLELEPDGETLSGHAAGADGVRREFHGWIGLMGVLDAVLDAAGKASSPTTQGETNAAR